MLSVPNTFAPPGIERDPFGTLPDDVTDLAIQPLPPKKTSGTEFENFSDQGSFTPKNRVLGLLRVHYRRARSILGLYAYWSV